MIESPVTEAEWQSLLRYLMDEEHPELEEYGSIVTFVDALLDNLDRPSTREKSEASRSAFESALDNVIAGWTPLEGRDAQVSPSFGHGLDFVQSYRPTAGWAKVTDILRRYNLLLPEVAETSLIRAIVIAHSYYGVPPQDKLDRQSYEWLVGQLATIAADPAVQMRARAYSLAVLVANGSTNEEGILGFTNEHQRHVHEWGVRLQDVREALRTFTSHGERDRSLAALDAISRPVKVTINRGNTNVAPEWQGLRQEPHAQTQS